MQFGPLYERAVDLSPRAARIAAILLVHEPDVPEALRRSLSMALAGDDETQDRAPDYRPDDRDSRAAMAFVQACLAVCKGMDADASHTRH